MSNVEECSQPESEPPSRGGTELQSEPDADPLGCQVNLSSSSLDRGGRRLKLSPHQENSSFFPFHMSAKLGTEPKPSEEFLCARCARHMKTCCQTSEVHATVGDEQRIRQYSGKSDFTEYRSPQNQDYQEQSDDPAWALHVFREDGSRRVLKRRPNGDCTFLGKAGCTLPLETRPLICRLYPFDYTEQGLTEDLAPGCPLELLRLGKGLIEELNMKKDDARRWHTQLYEEIRMESEHE